ncbi:MAG: hypothetical protein JXR36_06855 [Bacteroidales bacterium]|nr:hypothetical protein [Bacteroidales bacterium]
MEMKNRRASSGLVKAEIIRTVAMFRKLSEYPALLNSSIISAERVEGSVLLDFFVTFFIKKESLNFYKK